MFRKETYWLTFDSFYPCGAIISWHMICYGKAAMMMPKIPSIDERLTSLITSGSVSWATSSHAVASGAHAFAPREWAEPAAVLVPVYAWLGNESCLREVLAPAPCLET